MPMPWSIKNPDQQHTLLGIDGCRNPDEFDSLWLVDFSGLATRNREAQIQTGSLGAIARDATRGLAVAWLCVIL